MNLVVHDRVVPVVGVSDDRVRHGFRRRIGI